ncbi:sugar phosphate isomerase/epimerase family protein [Actinomadura kijaniata]|uniref:sugar phosphate isomerase/epimerase family protein n=1 Tax=Actinomadura kijaniata TaxID=46161 RepID=UPI003F1B487E
MTGAPRAHLDLAADFGAAHVRAFPAPTPPTPTPDAAPPPAWPPWPGPRPPGASRSRWRPTTPTAPDGPDAAAGRRARRGALWDVLHAHRTGETSERTHAALADRLAHVRVKDADPAEAPVALGAGTLPLDEVGRVLGAHGYDGWLCWEYDAAWHPRRRAAARPAGGRTHPHGTPPRPVAALNAVR